MQKWVYVVVGIAIIWALISLNWKRIKGYLRKEVITVRTSVINEQMEAVDRLDDQECCVCLVEPKQFRVAVTCGHSFCADCVFKIYDKEKGEKIKCPYCRADIVTIFKAFLQKHPEQKISQVRERIKVYNQKFGDDRSIKRAIVELPFVLTNIFDYIFSLNFLLFLLTNAVFFKALLVISLYFMLPYDLMPTSVLGVYGYIDNFAVLVAVSLFTLGKIGLLYIKSRL